VFIFLFLGMIINNFTISEAIVNVINIFAQFFMQNLGYLVIFFLLMYLA
jgi:hypothetical protein